ncbi:MAG: hypothetical protein K6F86_08560 [Lachnospiraceae bacterium]|nr:hypothetical protein [Lachnospiraceae bacterium]
MPDINERAKALIKVIDGCIKEGILPEFLKKYREAIMDDYLAYTQKDLDEAYIEDLQEDLKARLAKYESVG